VNAGFFGLLAPVGGRAIEVPARQANELVTNDELMNRI
jgi:hypothetical protein